MPKRREFWKKQITSGVMGPGVYAGSPQGQSPANYRRNEPDVISIEELSDNGLIDPNVSTKERSKALGWLAESIEQGS